MLNHLVRFAQVHESFRLAELQALADLHQVQIQVVHYSKYSPFAIVRLPAGDNLTQIVSRAILIQNVYELWGTGLNYEELHASVRADAADEIPKYLHCSFKFSFDSFQGLKSSKRQRQVIDSFAWLGFRGPISLVAPDECFVVFEEYEDPKFLNQSERDAQRNGILHVEPKRLYLGRLIANAGRDLLNTYTLKKRQYLSTTSMDAEISLIMANMAHARSGALFFDPFVGTGSLTVACAHYGAVVLGSDIDPRAIRGKDGLSLKTNYQQYKSNGRDLGAVVSDLVNTPLRGWSVPTTRGEGVHECEWLDGIICDPPYGVREGLKTLGKRNDPDKIIHYAPEGLPSYLCPGYIAPRKQYSFTAILVDLLSFAAAVLVPDGRLSFWMPTADEVEETLEIPMHQKLELVSVCIQPFYKWSRRLITYRKRHPSSCPPSALTALAGEATGKSDVMETERMQSIETTYAATKTNADDLNPFRRRYFEGFRTVAEQASLALPAEHDDHAQDSSK